MISTHVLDLALGVPARALAVHLDVLDVHAPAAVSGVGDGLWRRLASAVTNQDGRASGLAEARDLAGRTCRLTFETAGYFEATARPTFFPRVDVSFAVAAGADRCHVPLLLSPFGYSVYLGT
jgi:5-hydroxyisourate hydrolase